VSGPARVNDSPDLLERLAGAAVAVGIAVVGAPTLAVAAGLALVIDRRGWRRWPVAGCGLCLAVALGVAGGAHAYFALAGALVAITTGRPAGSPPFALGIGFAAAVGVALAPAVPTIVHHRDEHEETRHARQVSGRRRAAAGAARRVRRRRWPTPPGRAVLGVAIASSETGTGTGTGRAWRVGRVVTVPMRDWLRQALIVGETGSGKTVTALTVAGEAMRAGWDVYWIDGKADTTVADRFLTLADQHGRTARDGTRDPIDGWRGGTDSIVNRLLATQAFTEPYYEGIARNVLRWAVGGEPPRSFRELVERMDKRTLRRRWRDDPPEADKIRQLADSDFLGARYRYEGVAWAVGGSLDGAWSYEDVAAAYVPVGRPEHRHQASEIGAFLLEDLLHWAMARKDPARPALVVVDEFSRLAARPDAAIDLVERVRSFGVGVVLIAQTWASLGASETVRERLAGTVGTIVVHQLKVPERLAALAGTAWTLERTEQLHGLAHTGAVTQRVAHRFVVSPDDVRALPSGEAFLVIGASACQLRVRAPGPGVAARRTRDRDGSGCG
jgi:hypothetical protein